MQLRSARVPRTTVNKGKKKGRTPEEPDPRLTSNYTTSASTDEPSSPACWCRPRRRPPRWSTASQMLDALPHAHDLIRWWSGTLKWWRYVVAHEFPPYLGGKKGREMIPDPLLSTGVKCLELAASTEASTAATAAS